MTAVECDVLVVGGGLGGVAAALAACRAGCHVCLTEQTPWLGGQATSQGISVFHEHDDIETFGGTASYYALREGIRAFYRQRHELSAAAREAPFFNPGGGGGHLCFEPRVALVVLLDMLREDVMAGRLRIFYRARVIDVERHVSHVACTRLAQPDHGRTLEVRAHYVLDATELGDLLPLARIPWRTGAESTEQTGEPHARKDGPAPHLVQPFAVPFIVDLDGPSRLLEAGAWLPGTEWTFHLILSARQFAAGEIGGDQAMISWTGDPRWGADLVVADGAGRRHLIEAARAHTLQRLRWLQTEAPRGDRGGKGFPELRLRRQAMGSADGLSIYPHIRESRRIVARSTLREQDVAASLRQGARAARFDDSIGIGWHPIHLHGRPPDTAANGPTRPFQIPLGALIPAQGPDNLLAACRNIGVTHITNSCCRVHPVEWNVGEAAGALAGYCLRHHVSPTLVHTDLHHRRRFQHSLIDAGMPLFWFTDVPLGDDAFEAVQSLAAIGVLRGDEQDLLFRPDFSCDRVLRAALVETGVTDGALAAATNRAHAARAAWQVLCRS